MPDLESLLQPTFEARHVKAALKHFQAMTTEFQRGAWEEAIGKGGKFVEAAAKALCLHTGGTLPSARQFSAGRVLNALEQLPSALFDDTVRITIPRACRFAYDIASNRGARHDPAEVDPNEMDARVTVATVAWVLAEMLRYAQKGSANPDDVRELVDGLTQRRYSLIEDVDGRVYFHIPRASGRDLAVLSLWQRHPGRMTRDELVGAVGRHGVKKSNAQKAVTRIARLVDQDEHGRLRLLQPGLADAERMIDAAEIRVRLPQPSSQRRRRHAGQ